MPDKIKSKYQFTGDIDDLTLKGGNPFNAYWGDKYLTPQIIGDTIAYSNGENIWRVPLNKIYPVNDDDLTPQQRLERDWRKSPAYGIDKVILGTLAGTMAPFAIAEAAPALAGLATGASDAAVATRAGQAAYQGLTSPVGKAALSSVFGGMGAHNFFSDNGYAKTLQEWNNLKNDPNFYNAVNFGKSALGDAMDVTMMAPLYKPLTYAGKEMWNTGRQGVENVWNWAAQQGNDYARARQLSKAFDDNINRAALSAEEPAGGIIRTKLGDVEIDNPNLNYRVGTKDIVDDFENTGIVRAGETNHQSGIQADTSKGRRFTLKKVTYKNPMFKEGSLWYQPSDEMNGMLATNGKMQYAGKHSGPINYDMNGRRIPAEELNHSNTDAYIWEPNYGYRKVTQEPPTLSWEEASRPYLDWSPDNWFKNISGRTSYSAEEAEELASLVPEYRQMVADPNIKRRMGYWNEELQEAAQNPTIHNALTEAYSYINPTQLPEVTVVGNKKEEGGPLNTYKSWNDLSIKEKSEMMKVAIRNGITNLADIKAKYNEFAEGGYMTSEEDDDVNMYSRGDKLKKGKGYTISPNAQYAMRYFMNKGLAPHQAAGLVGNLMRESSLNPNAVNPNGGAFGLAQWLGKRKKDLFAKYGNNPSFNQQLDFIWHELNTTHKNGLKYLRASRDANEAAQNAFGWYEFSVGPQGAVADMNKHKQNGIASLNQGVRFASRLLGQPIPENIQLNIPAAVPQGNAIAVQPQMYQMQQPVNPFEGWEPSNPQAFYGNPEQMGVIEQLAQQNAQMQAAFEKQEAEKLLAAQQQALAQEREAQRNRTNLALQMVGMMGSDDGSSEFDMLKPLLGSVYG